MLSHSQLVFFFYVSLMMFSFSSLSRSVMYAVLFLFLHWCMHFLTYLNSSFSLAFMQCIRQDLFFCPMSSKFHSGRKWTSRLSRTVLFKEHLFIWPCGLRKTGQAALLVLWYGRYTRFQILIILLLRLMWENCSSNLYNEIMFSLWRNSRSALIFLHMTAPDHKVFSICSCFLV